MSWRTVVINSRCKLDYKIGYMVIRNDCVKRVYIDEIAILIIENPAVSLTGCLLEALIQNKVKVIFCDSNHSPQSELIAYNGSYDCARKIKTQIKWSKETKQLIWEDIVTEKIRKQAEFLNEIKKNKEAELLTSYISQIEDNDCTNREGHAAKVYFNALFGSTFTRSDSNNINACLNYGYSIILSAFNREVTMNGYLTQIGLFHDNMFNFFNLSSDLMEPYRILVDRTVYKLCPTKFEDDEKRIMCNILNKNITINNSIQLVLNGIKLYVRSVFEAINDNDISKIDKYEIVYE